MTTEIHQREKGRGSRWQDYVPLMVIVALMLLSACAKQFAYGEWNWMSWMHDFMGFFLVVFSMFKFFDMEGFADGFQMYDLNRGAPRGPGHGPNGRNNVVEHNLATRR